MRIVLVEPEIPPNTGNVARLCAATRVELHLIEPLGFDLSDRQLKRAGMDYWNHLTWRTWGHWSEFLMSLPASSQVWFVESGGPRHYGEVRYGPEDCLVFGRETKGLPRFFLEEAKEHWIRIPMFNRDARSLNLSNAVSLVLYEALRQQGFPDEVE